MAPRGWWRDCFYDHPLSAQKHPSSYANPGRDKIKVYCKPCLDQRIGNMQTADGIEVSAGREFSIRSVEDLQLLLFSVSPTSSEKGWIEARADTLLQHLRVCTLQGSAVQQRTIQELEFRKLPKSSNVNSGALPSGNRGDSPMEWQNTSPIEISQLAGPNYHRSHSFPPTLAPMPRYPSTLHINHSASPSPAPIDYESEGRPSKRLRTQTMSRNSSFTRDHEPSPAIVPFTPEQQTIFEDKIVRLTASASFPLSWVDNPEWISFCDTFIPGAKPVTRRMLTSRILPNSLKYLRASVKSRAHGKEGTVQADGWTGTNGHHLVAFMLTANHEIFTIKVEDTTTEKKTAENLLALMVKIMEQLRDEWHIEVIAFTTDASGESLKARKLLRKKYPHLVVPDCYAHQINLIVGDYFKSNADFLVYGTQANELITWLRKKPAVLGLIKDVLRNAGKPQLSVIRPVPTRWTAFYLAYRRLLDLRKALDAVVTTDALLDPKERHVVTGKKDAQEHATKMVAVIKSGVFWHELARWIKHHLAPLAIAANVTQSSFCRLDEVLMTFAYLYMEYSKLTTDNDAIVQRALLDSINRRWMKSDQDVFIAAVILNPFLKITPFRRVRSLLTNASIFSLLSRLWRRFYMEEPPHEMYGQLDEYLNDRGEFAQVPEIVAILKVEAEWNKRSPDPLRLYNDISIAGEERIALIRLAERLLSICPNSASCERLFSTFGLILTKLRNRLGNQNLVDLAELKMHIRDEHLRSNTKEKIRKRGFGVRVEAGAQTPGQPTPQVETPINAPTTAEPSTGSPSDDNEEPNDLLSTSTHTLRGMTANLTRLVDEDAENNNNDEAQTGKICMRLQDLFDYSKDHWVRAQQASAVGSLEEEEELYQLLNLDAEGDADLDPDLDDSTESILTL